MLLRFAISVKRVITCLRLSRRQTIRFGRSMQRPVNFVTANRCFLFHNIEGASNFGRELREFHLQCSFFWINHDVHRTRESCKILRDCRSHSTLNTITDDGFSHYPTNRDPDSTAAWISLRFSRRFRLYSLWLRAQQIKRRKCLRKVALSAAIHDFELGMLA